MNSSLSRAFDDTFGSSARQSIADRMQKRPFDYASEMKEHLNVADQLFEAIALAIHHATIIEEQPSVSKKVCTNLLTQIGRDIKGVALLVSSGFPYQAVAVSVSAFEHGMMAASIASDNARAQIWLKHSNPFKNLNSVKELVRLAVESFYRDVPQHKNSLGKPYEGIYGPLCLFKHGNPMVQQYIEGDISKSLPLSMFTGADKQALVAGFYALEAAIRFGGWIALHSFLANHAKVPAKLKRLKRFEQIFELDRLKRIMKKIDRVVGGLPARRGSFEGPSQFLSTISREVEAVPD